LCQVVVTKERIALQYECTFTVRKTDMVRGSKPFPWLIPFALLLVPALCAALFGSTAPQSTGTYYVDAVTGSDDNPGTGTQPWRTIQRAADVLIPGNIAFIHAGHYDERVSVTRSGAPGAPITLRAVGTVSLHTFTVEADYVTLEGFTVTNHAPSTDRGNGIRLLGNHNLVAGVYAYDNAHVGIYVDGTANTVRNCRAHRNGLAGIEVRGAGHLVEHNEVWGTVQYHPAWSAPPLGADADGFRFFGSGHVFRGNYVHDITYEDPFVVDAHVDAFQTWGGASDCLFEANRVHLPVERSLHQRGVGWMLEDATDLTIRNNVLDVHSGVNTAGGDNRGIKFYHNTLVSRRSFDSWSVGFTATDNCDVRNNIFVDFDEALLQRGGGDTVAGNCAWNSDGSSPTGDGDFWGLSPHFVDFEGGDYHLREGSPLVDVVAPLPNLTQDAEGSRRPWGRGSDVGAYEYHRP
jgi:hypothetical protein